LQRIVTTYSEILTNLDRERSLAHRQLDEYRERVGAIFKDEAYLQALTELRDKLKAALTHTPTEGEQTALELSQQIEHLRAVGISEVATEQKSNQCNVLSDLSRANTQPAFAR
jgi:ABC-type phosphate/phosphonate transport system ATPase subunit